MSKVCAFTGHRDLGKDFNFKALSNAIESLIETGYDTFLCGFAIGFDLACAECVISLKKKYDVKLIAYIPCEGQEKYYTQDDSLRYARALRECDEKKVLAPHYYNGCMQARDRLMVDGAEAVFAYLKKDGGGTYYTVSYAKKKEKEIILYFE